MSKVRSRSSLCCVTSEAGPVQPAVQPAAQHILGRNISADMLAITYQPVLRTVSAMEPNRDVVLRHDRKAGEKTFVDWAGDTVPIYDRETGEAAPASIFVAVLGASTYTFARAAPSLNLANWIDCHVRAFEFFQGVTKLLVPDNPRTGVTRACRYEPDLNRTYHEMAQHYSIAVLPARPYKPRDKAYASHCTSSGLCNTTSLAAR